MRILERTAIGRVEDHRAGEAPYYNFRIFDELRTSASSQFDRAGLEDIVRIAKAKSKKVIIADLREESHGLLSDGSPASWRSPVDHNWANRGRSHRAIKRDEEKRLNGIGETEAEICRRLGAEYARFFVTDHMKPDDKVVDAFVALLRANESKDVWFHFHCKAGKGRTTTFLVLKEIFDRRNDRTSVETIVRRQALAGGVDLFARRTKDDYTFSLHESRARLVRDFYAYCHTTGLDAPFSVWRRTRKAA